MGSGVKDVLAVPKGFTVDCDDVVAGRQADVLSHGTYPDSTVLVHFIHQDVRLAVYEDYSDKDQNPNDHVHCNTTEYHNKALPCGLGTELPGLRGLLHRFGIQRFIDHA